MAVKQQRKAPLAGSGKTSKPPALRQAPKRRSSAPLTAVRAKRRAGPRLPGFEAATPEEAGMCRKELDKIVAASRRNVQELGALPGCAHVVLKDGKCVFAHADGWSDVEKKVKFSLGTLCPLHGATKPLLAAAFLTLVEEGAVKLTDPIKQYIAFPDSVAKGSGATKALMEATLGNLLTMTGGLGYDDCPSYKRALAKIKKGEIADLPGMCQALAEVPLPFQPGTRYHYSFSTDVLGHICEKVSGQRIDQFMKKRLLQPLGMRETFFEQVIPKSKQRQMTVMYESRRVGQSRRFRLKRYSSTNRAPGIMTCGGGILGYRDYGMVSSVRDYARFVQMILNGGVVPGGARRLLREATVRSLWLDGLAPFQRKNGRLPGWNDAESPTEDPRYWDKLGWSLLNTHLVFDEKPRRSPPRRADSMWMGGGGGAFWTADAKRGLVTLSFAPVFGGRSSEDDGLGPLGNDCAPLVIAAVEAAAAEAAGPPRKSSRR